MSKIAILIADGCEECEALIQVDMLRRAGIDIDMVSISDSKQVTSARRITFVVSLYIIMYQFLYFDHRRLSFIHAAHCLRRKGLRETISRRPINSLSVR